METSNNTKRAGDRLAGLARIAFGGIIMTADQALLVAGGTLFAIEGLGDVLTGESHYLISKTVDLIKYGRQIEYD